LNRFGGTRTKQRAEYRCLEEFRITRRPRDKEPLYTELPVAPDLPYRELLYSTIIRTRGSSVDTVKGHGLDDPVSIPSSGKLSLLYSHQTDYGSLSDSYTMGPGGSFSEGVKLDTHFHLLPSSYLHLHGRHSRANALASSKTLLRLCLILQAALDPRVHSAHKQCSWG
jgi:hypothetical protein